MHEVIANLTMKVFHESRKLRGVYKIRPLIKVEAKVIDNNQGAYQATASREKVIFDDISISLFYVK